MKRKKRQKKSASKKRFSPKKNKIKYLISVFILLLTAFFVVYTLFVFPETLSRNIKNDLIAFYKPILTDDSKELFIIKVKNKPDEALQKNVFLNIRNKYGLDLYFESIKEIEDQQIKKINFIKNDKEYKGIIDFYIYWDNIPKFEIDENNEKILIKKEIADLSKKENYEKIDERLKNEKKEKLIKPDINEFKKVIKSGDLKALPQVVIIIDDLGYTHNSAYDFLTLGFPVTFALIPGLNDSKKFYNLFHNYGYELILHIPMEPEKGKKYVEKNAIFSEMSNNEVKDRVRSFFDEYPNVAGANNHMGSRIISDRRIMDEVFKEIKSKNKIWVDSKTNVNNVSKETALDNNIVFFERDVFLDNSKDIQEIKLSMNKLIKEAKRKGYAVGIGHIQTKELVAVLKEYYNKKDELGIEFISLSKLKKK